MQHYNILIIGFPKSGTTSINESFKRSGITSYHQNHGKKEKIGDLIYKNYFQTGNIFSSFDTPIAITQADYIKGQVAVYPQLDYNLLLNTFEQDNVKFILNYRTPKNIIDSFNRWHNNARKRLVDANVPGLPTGFGNTDNEMEKWITDHFTYCRKLFGHSKRFLEIDIESNNVKQQLESFLDIEIKWWGRKNAN